MSDPLSERLARCYTAAINDVMHGMGLHDFVLPYEIAPLAPGCEGGRPGLHLPRPRRPRHHPARHLHGLDRLPVAGAGRLHRRLPAQRPHRRPYGRAVGRNAEAARRAGLRRRWRLPRRGVHPRDRLPRLVPLCDARAISSATGCRQGWERRSASAASPSTAAITSSPTADGVVVVPQDKAAAIVAEAERVMAAENQVRKAILDGMDPQQAYLKYRKF